MTNEALRLAEILEQTNQMYPNADVSSVEVAAELRRLHEVNQAMLEALSRIDVYLSDTLSGRVKPEPETYKQWLVEGIIEARNRARATITKAKQRRSNQGMK
jgi:hypothetical protein